MSEKLETTWDKLQDVLNGKLQRFSSPRRHRRVTMVIYQLPEEDVVVVREVATHPVPKNAQGAQWARRLEAWAESHPHLPHEVDDSRDTIYAEAVRDLR